MKYSTQTSSKSMTSMEAFDLLQATESMNQARMDLTDSLRNLDEVCEIVDNINKASKMISQYGANAIQILNVDGSLESLFQIPEKMIIIEKAQEGLGDAFNRGWEAFKNWIKRICMKFAIFFKSLSGKFSNDQKQLSLALARFETSEVSVDKKCDSYCISFSDSAKVNALCKGFIDKAVKGYNEVSTDIEKSITTVQDINSLLTNMTEVINKCTHLKDELNNVLKPSKCSITFDSHKFVLVEPGILGGLSESITSSAIIYNLCDKSNNEGKTFGELGWSKQSIANTAKVLLKMYDETSSIRYNSYMSENKLYSILNRNHSIDRETMLNIRNAVSITFSLLTVISKVIHDTLQNRRVDIWDMMDRCIVN